MKGSKQEGRLFYFEVIPRIKRSVLHIKLVVLKLRFAKCFLRVAKVYQDYPIRLFVVVHNILVLQNFENMLKGSQLAILKKFYYYYIV